MGATVLRHMQEDSGRGPGEVAKAFTISRETLHARALWAKVDALDGKVPESVQIDALQVIWLLQRSMTRCLLVRRGALPGTTAAVAREHAGLHPHSAREAILPHSPRPEPTNAAAGE